MCRLSKDLFEGDALTTDNDLSSNLYLYVVVDEQVVKIQKQCIM